MMIYDQLDRKNQAFTLEEKPAKSKSKSKSKDKTKSRSKSRSESKDKKKCDEKFETVVPPSGAFMIGCMKSGYVLAGKPNTNANVVQSARDDPHRWFVMEPVNDGYSLVRNVASDLVLDVKDGATGNCSKVIMWSAHKGPNQLWKLVAHPAGGYYFVNQGSNRVLDVPKASDQIGTADDEANDSDMMGLMRNR